MSNKMFTWRARSMVGHADDPDIVWELPAPLAELILHQLLKQGQGAEVHLPGVDHDALIEEGERAPGVQPPPGIPLLRAHTHEWEVQGLI